ncbi:hypothetical protein AXK60_17505 [Tsukamurella pseudospumae]|uniref:PknH-like extracellular domain-containing protein n=1 Tax=Tsukamurella pseudospumae TaxID=239498 RepID=A0A137ZZH8_9ACTN|nr:hypothetical protein AXK60_17505 [Tsukamurella pseudospumae]
MLVLLFVAFFGWVVLSDDPRPTESDAWIVTVLPPKSDVERITKAAFATETEDDPRAEPDEFRGADACRTAWQPLRGTVVGSATTVDRTFDSGRPEARQVELGVARFADEASARSAVDRINNDVARCSQSFFVRDGAEANDWRVQQSAGEWYLRPIVAREGDWYCAAGIRSDGRYVLRALECRTGSNYVPALLDAMEQRIRAA